MVVLHQSSGEVMASRVFDTYMPGGEEDLVGFLNSISDGRILCLAIEVIIIGQHPKKYQV